MKRLIDISVSLFTLIIISPLLLIIALAVKLDSRGPALFRQGRLTKDGKEFTMYKFRTMVENAENMGTGIFSFENDTRVTRMGRFLRKTSLDELPQLFNVLAGDMSIVGPRPPITYELGDYDSLSDKYLKRFTVLAGITGFAQVNGRNEIQWDDKVALDNQYVDLFQQQGVLLDLKIIWKTLFKVLSTRSTSEIVDSTFDGWSEEEIATKGKEYLAKNASRKS